MLHQIVIKSSSISDKGVFANKNFKKGEIVLTWNPKKINKSDVDSLSEHEKHYVVKSTKDYLQMQSPEKYVNHSCDPNTKMVDLSDVAIRIIKKDEEITSDYFGSGIIEFKCKCGSKNCRGLIR